MPYQVIAYTMIFLYGIIIGSFLNVCIYRIPTGESIVTKRSHCMSCKYQLRWFDLVPLFSWIFLGGKCRHCKAKISAQYPIVEALNGAMWVVTFLLLGFTWDALIACLAISALLVIACIDWRTYEIPFGINIFLTVLGVIHLLLHLQDWPLYGIGFVAISGFLTLVYFITKGRGIGGGDIKLMAACGLLLGWKLILVAFFFGCLYGSVIHLIRMRVSKTSHVLAFGPYLAGGILTALWFGEELLNRYLMLFA